MRGRVGELCVWTALCALSAAGCEGDAPAPLPTPPAPAPTSPAEVRSTLHTVHTVLTLTQGLLDAPAEVVVERRRRCQVAFDPTRAELQLVQSSPEQVRVRDGDRAWQAIPAEQDDAPLRQLPGQSLLRAWLPLTAARADQRWTRTAELEVAGRRVEVTHVTEVTRAAGGGLRVTTQAQGQRSWEGTGVSLSVTGEGQALVRDGVAAWPTRIAVTYRVRAHGGPGADVESSVGFELTVAEEPRS